MDIASVLRDLSGISAVAGFEQPFSRKVKDLFEKNCDMAYVDKFMNVIGTMRGSCSSGRVMIMAHYDEIGLLVRSIDERGFIKVAPVGGVDPRILLAQEVTVHGRKDLPGIIGAKPPHLIKQEDSGKAVKLTELTVDTGMDAVSLREIVSVGDAVTLASEPALLMNNRFRAKAMDNRSSIAAVLQTMELLSKTRFENDMVFVATAQEELSLTGSITASYNVSPDIAVVVDACHGDMPDVSGEDTSVLGKGPAIGIGHHMHRKLTGRMVEIAKQEGIPYQIDVEVGDSGTEAWATQISKNGIPTVLLSIPVRYMHTAVETVGLDDIAATARLIARFVSSEGVIRC